MTLLPILPPWLFWPLVVLALYAAVVLLAKGPGRTATARRARQRFATLTLLVLLACARPGMAGETAPALATDLNVFFVADTSPSSAAEDWHGSATRMEGIGGDINAIAAKLAGARFSLITFDHAARVVLPLTTDTTALRTATQVLAPRPAQSSQGSSVSSARDLLGKQLAQAVKSHPERPRLVFYLGDGEQTAASAPATFAPATGTVNGGAVLGYGTAAGGKMRDHSYSSTEPGPYLMDKSQDSGAAAISRIDEKELREIAGQLGVPYVHRTSPDGIETALTQASPYLAAHQPGQSGKAPARMELYWVPALAAFAVAVWELSASLRLWQMFGPGQPRQGRRGLRNGAGA